MKRAAVPTPPTTLLEAAFVGDLDATRALLARGADPDERSAHDALPLTNALMVRGSRPDADAVAALLLEHGADPLAPGYRAETPLALAARLGADALARAMVERVGARLDVHSAGGLDGSLFQRACRGGLGWLARRCVAGGVDPTDANGADALGLHWVVLGSRVGADPSADARVAMIDWLIELGCDPNLVQRGERAFTPLHLASAYVDARLVRRLIAHGARVDARVPPYDRQPLHEAAANSAEVVRALVAAGADATATDSRGETPLHCFASRTRYRVDPDILDALVSAGGRLDAADARGLTPLGLALGTFGAAPKTPSDRERALLARYVALGADPSVPGPKGVTLLILASRVNDPELFAVALAEGGLDARDAQGWSALHYAATHADGELVRRLLDAGATKSLPTAKNRSYAKVSLPKGSTAEGIARATGASGALARLTAG